MQEGEWNVSSIMKNLREVMTKEQATSLRRKMQHKSNGTERERETNRHSTAHTETKKR